MSLESLRAKRRIKRILKPENKESKIVKINLQKNSINGTIIIDNVKLFFKLLERKKAKKEIAGYKDLIGKYPIPQVERVLEDYDDVLILYQYEKTIGKNKGLLSDEINKKLESQKKVNLNKIFSIWRENFLNSVRWSLQIPENSEFFKKRIQSTGRYDLWYNKSKVKVSGGKYGFNELMKKKYIVNGKLMDKTPYELYKRAKKSLTKNRRRIELLSQGDPIEMNIGMRPIFFDFETAGMEDFLGENAIFIYSILIDGGYFSPKYHRNAFWLYKRSLKNMEKHSYNYLNYKVDDQVIIDYELKVPAVRIKILQEYFKQIVKPVLRKSKLSFSKYLEYLNNYLFARFMLVHNVQKMEINDIFFTVAMISEINHIGLSKYMKKVM